MAAVSELRRKKGARTWGPNRWGLQFNIAENISAPFLGEWVDTEGTYPFTVTVVGDFQGVAHLLASNEKSDSEQPGEGPSDSATDYPQLGSDILEAQAIEIRAPYRWIKLWVETVTSGSIRRASFLGVENDGS